MKKKPYQRRCGDFEIRVLADGRLVMLAPDDELLAMGQKLEPDSPLLTPKREDKKNGRS